MALLRVPGCGRGGRCFGEWLKSEDLFMSGLMFKFKILCVVTPFGSFIYGSLVLITKGLFGVTIFGWQTMVSIQTVVCNYRTVWLT